MDIDGDYLYHFHQHSLRVNKYFSICLTEKKKKKLFISVNKLKRSLKLNSRREICLYGWVELSVTR